jgi:predicted kinase
LSEPVLVIVSGPPGAGKSTIAKRLGAELGLPVLDRDDIKDTMFDTIGWSDREWSQRLGGASWHLLLMFAERLLTAGQSVILDSNFERGCHPQLREIAGRAPYRLVEVHCSAEDAVIARRFKQRWDGGGRHPGHATAWSESEYLDQIAHRKFVPLEESDVLIEVDTNDFDSVDVTGIVSTIRPQLRRSDGHQDR